MGKSKTWDGVARSEVQFVLVMLLTLTPVGVGLHYLLQQR